MSPRTRGLTTTHGHGLSLTLSRVRGSFKRGTVVHLKSGIGVRISIVPANGLLVSHTLNINNFTHNHVIRVCKPRSSNGAALALATVTRTRGSKNLTTFVSIRRTLSPRCTTHLNIGLSSLLISRPDSNRRTLRVYRTLIHSGTVSIVIISSITTLIAGRRLRKRVKSSAMKTRTHLVSTTLHGLADFVSGTHAIYVFAGRVHRGVNIVFNGPRAAPNNHTLGFCTSMHISVHHVNRVGNDSNIVTKGHAGVGMIGGGITPPFARYRFSVVCGRNVSSMNDLLSLTARCSVVRGHNS